MLSAIAALAAAPSGLGRHSRISRRLLPALSPKLEWSHPTRFRGSTASQFYDPKLVRTFGLSKVVAALPGFSRTMYLLRSAKADEEGKAKQRDIAVPVFGYKNHASIVITHASDCGIRDGASSFVLDVRVL